MLVKDESIDFIKKPIIEFFTKMDKLGELHAMRIDAPKFTLTEDTLLKLLKESGHATLYVATHKIKDRMVRAAYANNYDLDIRCVDEDVITVNGIKCFNPESTYKSFIIIKDANFLSEDVLELFTRTGVRTVLISDAMAFTYRANTFYRTKVDVAFTAVDRDTKRSTAIKLLMHRVRKNTFTLDEKMTSDYKIRDLGLSSGGKSEEMTYDSSFILELMNTHDVTVTNNSETKIILNNEYRKHVYGSEDHIPAEGEKLVSQQPFHMIINGSERHIMPAGLFISVQGAPTCVTDKLITLPVKVNLHNRNIIGTINVNLEFLKSQHDQEFGKIVRRSSLLDGDFFNYGYCVGLLEVFDEEIPKVNVLLETNKCSAESIRSWLYNVIGSAVNKIHIGF